MKSFKKVLMLVIVLLALCLVGCKKDKDPIFTPTQISKILTESKNNDNVNVEGVVYGVVKNGFYISDSTDCGIFVIMGSNWTKNVSVKDKVQLSGQFSYVSNFPQIKNATIVKTVSANNGLTMTEEDATVSSIKSLSPTEKIGVYGKMVRVVGTISKNAAQLLTLSDDEGNQLLINSNSNITALESKMNSRVRLSLVVHSYSSTENNWIVSFAKEASDILDMPLTFDTIVTMAKEHIESIVPSEIYGALELPFVHSTFSYITYSWKVEENNFVSITESGKVEVVLDEADHEVTFTVTITDGKETEDVEYKIVSKAITESSVTELLENPPVVNYSVVIVKGIVVGIGRNQSLSLRTYILQDPVTKKTTTADFTNADDGYIKNDSEEFKQVKVGDEVVITGAYRKTDRPTIINVSEIEIKSSGNSFEHDYDNAYVLNNQESYEEFGKNYLQYLNKLVKLENPFMNYSTSGVPADTNWVRLGHSPSGGDAGYGVSGDVHNLAFLIAAQNETLGSDSWHTNYEIPFVSTGAKQFNVTIYAYAIYVSASYIAFIIPDIDCYQTTGIDKITMDLAESVPNYLNTTEVTELILPTNHPSVGAVTWSSSNEDVYNSTTGAISVVSESTVITVTAKFIFNGEEVEVPFSFTVLPTEALSVADVLSMTEEKVVKVSGVIIGFVSDGNTVESRKGVLLMDNISGKTILVNGLGNIGGSYGAYVDSEGNAIGIGDKVTIIGDYLLSSPQIGSGPEQTNRVNIDLARYGEIKLDYHDVAINYQLEEVLTIASHEDMLALAENLKFGTIIKIVGTTENPIYLGGSSSSSPFNIKVFMSNAVDNNGTKYNGQTFALKTDVNVPNGGETWYTDLFGITGAFVGPNSSNAAIPVVGEMYVVVGYNTSTYYQMSIVALEEWAIRRELTSEQLEEVLGTYVPQSASEGEWTALLPTSTNFTEGIITWTSSDPTIIDLENKYVTAPYEATVVKLTATFTKGGIESSFEYEVAVEGATMPDPVNVSTLLVEGVNGSLAIVEGVFATYHSDGNENGNLRGIILMDKNTSEILLVDGMQYLISMNSVHGVYYASNETLLKIGDELRIRATYLIDDEGRKSLLVSETSKIEILSNENPVVWGTPDITISNDEELASFAMEPQIGVLIKFVGTTEKPFCVGGSSTTASKVNYKLSYRKDATTNTEFNYDTSSGKKDFSFKGVINELNAGQGWWKELFGLPEGPFVAPTDSNVNGTTRLDRAFQLTGEVYCVLCAVTPSYYQLAIVNPTASTMHVVVAE